MSRLFLPTPVLALAYAAALAVAALVSWLAVTNHQMRRAARRTR